MAGKDGAVPYREAAAAVTRYRVQEEDCALPVRAEGKGVAADVQLACCAVVCRGPGRYRPPRRHRCGRLYVAAGVGRGVRPAWSPRTGLGLRQTLRALLESHPGSSPPTVTNTDPRDKRSRKLRLRRGRLCAVLSLVCVYLAGVLLLSSVSIDPHYYSNMPAGVGAAARGQAGGGGVGGAGRRARSRLHWCRPLHFLSPPGPVVALVSFPGSGNTWLRYLLQQATGVYTGSVYKDFGLLKNGFPAESVCNGSVLVVKTHESGAEARAPFSRAVLLVRAPAPAILAEFNRQSGGHVGFASPDRYHRNRGKYWESFVRSMVAKWRALNLDWLRNFPGELLVARYEALAAADAPALRAHLLRLLRFLRADAAVSAQQLACTVVRREGIYRRRRRAAADAFDPFSEDMKRDLRAAEDEVFAAIRDFQLRQQRLLGAGVDPGPGPTAQPPGS
ncbi:WSCD family member AAEL009094-like [Schistocerca serialis cubense]|uniref:WSCD family member AAEL009094-like n=1 Tax=Schistocerca serialis cubense TaxID=2023355 RepID=UPI00214E862A|nr:WSCD family member AAEL009094-like [Schistocerca serialis cubense]